MNAMVKILLFEDEKNIAENLKFVFQTEGFSIVHASSAQEGLRFFQEQSFDLLILDVGLPDISGFEVCKQIRTKSQVPIFFLTARSDEIDRILGLELGADDYITKPFSPREVAARVKAHFRRAQAQKPAAESVKRGAFEIFEDRYQITFKGKPLELRRYEFGILKFLLENPDKVYSRSQIMEKVWTEPDMSLERTVDTHIKVIRSRLKELDEQEWIQTHRGFGYSFKGS
jgi:two-component system, OmpR family, catabolic regulation response regulator CreB